jgi:ABC-type cobalamin/Fe3+-siderophores transport system ATPase subunit
MEPEFSCPEPDWHNSPLAETLCTLLQEQEANGTLGRFNNATQCWWEDHKKRDKERLEKELREAEIKQQKLNALCKLSEYERQLLGIK